MSDPKSKPILASASTIRLKMLLQAGVDCDVQPSNVDERDLEQSGATTDYEFLAKHLAQAKALNVAARFPQRLIIGADQILVLGSRKFDKPEDIRAARAQLKLLRGNTHRLISAAVCAQNSQVVWSHVESADLVMRDFSDDFLEKYLVDMGETVSQSVGGYKIEGAGLQLFEKINGDHFTILGLPLLPLLAFLRTRGALPS